MSRDHFTPFDRVPPQNLEAEQGVLGSVLLDNDVLHEVVPHLKVEDFYRDSHQTIYRAIREEVEAIGSTRALVLCTPPQRAQAEKVGELLGDRLAGLEARLQHQGRAVRHRRRQLDERLHAAERFGQREDRAVNFDAGVVAGDGRLSLLLVTYH